ncbi:MAG: sugar acetyltransferase, partial [Alphaproteobacteria bacterium]|nr:sugar acetyltransferase [Alphaproteobacteria bacterium]
MPDPRPVIILNAGSHARVIADALLARRIPVLGYTDPARDKGSAGPLDLPVLGGDEAVLARPPHEIRLAIGVGSTGDAGPRRRLYDRFTGAGYGIVAVLYPDAVIARGVVVGRGAQVMAGAVVQAGTTLGTSVVVNTAASVDHDCHLGAHAHVAPGGVLCGNVTVGDGAHIGAGADALVGLGIVVLGDVPPGLRLSPRTS